MPTPLQIAKLEQLEREFHIATGHAGMAIVQVGGYGPIPAVEIEGFEGTTVIVRTGALPPGEFLATVNGTEHSSGSLLAEDITDD